ncbi:MAG: hypothetical protein QNK37_03670 [Acidobacteriota bacterium]|nr:hypothetical protein [Acidobacteriota bacterium]
MLQLNLTYQDASILAGALENYVSDLSMEIAGTDSKDFRDNLKLRRDVLVRVIHNLKE